MRKIDPKTRPVAGRPFSLCLDVFNGSSKTYYDLVAQMMMIMDMDPLGEFDVGTPSCGSSSSQAISKNGRSENVIPISLLSGGDRFSPVIPMSREMPIGMIGPGESRVTFFPVFSFLAGTFSPQPMRIFDRVSKRHYDLLELPCVTIS